MSFSLSVRTQALRWALVPVLLLAGFVAPAPSAEAQERSDLPEFLLDPALYGDRTNEKKALMDGNRVSITFFNTGLLGGEGEVRGNWPKGSEDFYVAEVLPVIVAEVPLTPRNSNVARDTLIRHVSTTRGPGTRGPPSQPGNPSNAYTLEPKPGFAATQLTDEQCIEQEQQAAQDSGEEADGLNDRPAISTDPCTWPTFWPDQPDWIDPATGRAQWNGFFGRDQFNADLETFFWSDDQRDRDLQERFDFRADSLRADRNGLGLDLKVRHLQWSQFLAQDALFSLYEVTNTSTTTYPRVSVGLVAGTLAGGDGDSDDDLAFFDQANRVVYSYDNDLRGNQGQEVGYVGYAFLESPGNADNAIDDDGDGDPTTEQGLNFEGIPFVTGDRVGVGNLFGEEDFLPRTLAEGDPIILIGEDGQRTIEYVTGAAREVVSQGRTYRVGPGTTLEERQILVEGQIANVIVTEKNLLDEDLDGLIDEDRNLHFNRRAQAFDGEVITLPAVRFKDFVGLGERLRDEGREAIRQDSLDFGLLNPMIDERRDDGIDNDGDWTTDDDDGADGLPGTGDLGEGDGVATPGERNFDDVDINESDQVGLSSFFYFTPAGALPLANENSVWEGVTPGFFTTNEELQTRNEGGGVDGDFIFSSGYFSLEPGETLRFTLALVFGEDLEAIINNTKTIQEIYNRNYQFARPPDRPTLFATPGDGRVTLYWDNASEGSVDPVQGQDFQGYKLYKSTDPFFGDPDVVTDAAGRLALLDPIAQFDVADGVQGVWPNLPPPAFPNDATAADSARILSEYLETINQSEDLQERTNGTPFFLGTDTGLRYTFVDSLVSNGQRYYYALNAYDSGTSPTGQGGLFYPAENNFLISVSESGAVTTGQNVVEVIPNAPTAGYVEGGLVGMVERQQGDATGGVEAEVVNPSRLIDGGTYQVTFRDTGGSALDAEFFTVVSAGDTLVAAGEVGTSLGYPFDGVRLDLDNDPIALDTTNTEFINLADNGQRGRFSVVVANFLGDTGVQLSGQRVPFDYEIQFESGVVTRSVPLVIDFLTSFPERDARFRVFNRTTNQEVPFVFNDLDGNGTLSGDGLGEFIVILEPSLEGTPLTYRFGAARNADATVGPYPVPGDVYQIATLKPFGPDDIYTFQVEASTVDEEAAREELDLVRVVPNPYVAAASWERDLPQTTTSGRGERRVDFINLPAGARVRVYNVRGSLIWEGRHDGVIDRGTLTWDLRTREGLETAYGVYFYHVEVDGLGETTGKLALIK
ncbi:MAG: hypothetical protein AAGG50_17360 [Bacteroidota bacterium]